MEFTAEQLQAQIDAALKTKVDEALKIHLAPFSETLKGITETLKGLAEKPKVVEPPKVEPPAPKKGEGSPEQNAELLTLRKSLETLSEQHKQSEERRAAAEKKSAETAKESAIRAELNKFAFANEEAANDAYMLVSGQLTSDEAGTLLGPGNLPAGAFLADYLPTKKAHLLSRTGAGGAGPTGGQKIGPANAASIEEIKAGMPPERLAVVGRSIIDALKAQG